MTRFQRIASIVSVLAVASVGVVSVASASPDPQGQSQDAGARHHERHGRGGDLVRAALHLDSLSASQRQQIEQLAAGEKAAHANVQAARAQLMQAVASGVASGNVSDGAVAPRVQAVEAAIAADEPGDRAALERLHAILTPSQRVELVTKIEARGAKMREHAQEWRAAHPDVAQGHEGRLGPMGRALGLSDAQRAQIKANLAATEPSDQAIRIEARAEHERVLEAFKGDRFVMNEIAPPRDPRLVQDQAEGTVRLAKAAAPVLTADQRATVAAKMQEMSTRHTRQ